MEYAEVSAVYQERASKSNMCVFVYIKGIINKYTAKVIRSNEVRVAVAQRL